MKNEEYIWYASYGSNLSKDRFYCYIRGGKPQGSSSVDSGCRDKTLPLEDKKLIINYELFFVERSKRWGDKGVAVISSQKQASKKTFARMYLIKKEQFIDVVKQENGIQVEEPLDICFPEFIEGNSEVIFGDKRYGKILCLGKYSDYPIFTFTSPDPVEKLSINQPSENYLKMIASGISETFELSSIEIAEYFINLKGVKGNYQLRDLIKFL